MGDCWDKRDRLLAVSSRLERRACSFATATEGAALETSGAPPRPTESTSSVTCRQPRDGELGPVSGGERAAMAFRFASLGQPAVLPPIHSAF